MESARKVTENGQRTPTVIPLREYIDQRLMDMQRHYDARLQAIRDATDSALEANERRLTSMNEFREQLRDQAARLVGREEVTLMIAKLQGEVRTLEIFRTTVEAKASQSSVTIAQLIGIVGIVLAIISLVVRLLEV